MAQETFFIIIFQLLWQASLKGKGQKLDYSEGNKTGHFRNHSLALSVIFRLSLPYLLFSLALRSRAYKTQNGWR